MTVRSLPIATYRLTWQLAHYLANSTAPRELYAPHEVFLVRCSAYGAPVILSFTTEVAYSVLIVLQSTVKKHFAVT